LFPFYLTEVSSFFRQLVEAKHEAYGGNGKEICIKSLIAALADSEEDYKRYELVVDELQDDQSPLYKMLSSKAFYPRDENLRVID
jgi:hypothetical protein